MEKAFVSERHVLVAGCFDLLHPGHVVFLNKAASYGNLYVSLGSDQSIIEQKHRTPTFSELERKYMLENLRCVYGVKIVSDPGPLGFREYLDEIGPDIFVINEDGDTPEKRALVESFGVEYRVFPRDTFDPSRPTSSTTISQGSQIPTRLQLCGGFMDNPTVNSQTGTDLACLVVVPIEPLENLQDRSGMATSTIRTVNKYFGTTLPLKYTIEQLGEMIFCLENPPHKRGYISGTYDSFGILGQGINLFSYRPGTFIPESRQSLTDEATLNWLEEHVYLKQSWRRPADCRIAVNSGHPQFSYYCRAIHDASLACWDAVQRHDLNALAAALNVSRDAETHIVPMHCPQNLREFIAREGALGAMIMGAGGGGYVCFVNEEIPLDGIRIAIRRGSL